MTDGGARIDYEERPYGAGGAGSGRVARLYLDRAAKRNAIGPGVIAGLKDACAELAADDGLRAVVLAGAGGKTFAAGADVNTMTGLTPDSARAFITALHEAIDAVRTLPVPVIAAIRGHCLGAAVELAAACDIRAGDTTAVIAMPEVRVGIPSVIEAALLPDLVGWGAAREMLLTGRDYGAAEAAAVGFLQKVTAPADLDAAVDAWLDAILACGPAAVRTQKKLLNEWQEMSLTEAVAVSIDAFAASFETGEPARMLAGALKARRER
ncbi:MAG: enoyl-CoA hydratase-related protein [Rhodospirillaceae bacterium]|nr:enoyl-CoA hydratase-related protein [Rhodospirillaceae bacterium]MCY4067362.1 enoyl-CoA hydratase-related protein [Rhodospirillaceae bacterium]